jgi:hypothetical protein
MRIRYMRVDSANICVLYWLDDVFLAAQTTQACSYEDAFVWLHWVADEGSAYFDDIALRTCDCPGDLDCDKGRDLADFGLFASAYGTLFGDPDYRADADLDRNGVIDVSDVGMFAMYLGQPCPSCP